MVDAIIVVAHLGHLGLKILVLGRRLLGHFPLLLLLLLILELVIRRSALHFLHELSMMHIISVSVGTEVLGLTSLVGAFISIGLLLLLKDLILLILVHLLLHLTPILLLVRNVIHASSPMALLVIVLWVRMVMRVGILLLLLLEGGLRLLLLGLELLHGVL